MSPLCLNAMRDELCKLGEDNPAEIKREPQTSIKKPSHPLVTAARAIGSLGAGIAVGQGGLMAANALSKHFRGGRPLITSALAQTAVPVLGGLSGLAFDYAMQHTLSKMQRDQEQRRLLSGG